MREKWVRMSMQNDGEAPGEGQDSISKHGEGTESPKVVRVCPPLSVRVNAQEQG